MTELVVRTLLTYLLHSSALLVVALAVRHALGERRLALQEAVLRAALVGAFATAPLQLLLELKPLGGELSVPLAAPPAATSARFAAGAATDFGGAARPAAPSPAAFASEGALAPGAPPVHAGGAELAAILGVPWPTALSLAWALVAAIGLLRLGVAAVQLRRLLRGRRPIGDVPLAPRAAGVAVTLGLAGAVRLSTAPRLAVPLARGVLRPEVCLPARVVELGPDEQLALCAHELAHVARRDPAWILLARLVEAVAPLQPLNGWARRRLGEISECLSDDLAVFASARPGGLARSLVDVATWMLADRAVVPAAPVAAAGALSAGSRLGHRVERLMNPLRPLERPRRLLFPLAAAAALATATLTPAVSATVQAPAPAALAAEPRAAQAPAVPATPQAAPVPATPQAAPVPATPQATPVPAGADSAPASGAGRDRDREALERRLAELSRRIEERVRAHEGEMKALEREMQALSSRVAPDAAETQRLAHEMEAAAQELARSALAHHELTAGAKTAQAQAAQAQAAQRVAELQRELQSQVGALGTEQARALAEKARALADEVRPAPEELAELQRLAHELASISADLQGHGASLQAHEAMEQARRAMQDAAAAMRRAVRESAGAAQPRRQGSPQHE